MKNAINLIVLLTIGSFGFTQTDSISSVLLDTFSVNALQSATNPAELPHNITIISKKDIRNSNANDLGDLLRQYAGIEVQSRGAFGTQNDLSIYGSTYNQTQILINGVKSQDPLTGHFNLNSPVNLNNIEQIEIIKGSTSSLHGANAVGGIINIVTTTDDESTINAKLQIGDFDYIGMDIGGKTNYSLGSLFINVSTKNTKGQPTLGGMSTSFDMKNVNVGADFKLSAKNKLSLLAGYDERQFNAQYFYTRSSFDRSVETVRGLFFQATDEVTINEKQDLKLGYSLRNGNDEFIFNPLFTINTHNTNSHIIFARHKVQLKNIAINSGLEHEITNITSNDRGIHTDYNSAAFVNGSFKYKGIYVSPSLRLDYNPTYKFELLPGINASYTKSNATFWGGVNRSIRKADFTERYISNNIASTLSAGRNLGNPDLQAETAISSEVGLKYQLKTNGLFTATVFNRDSRNLIDYILTNSNFIDNENLMNNANYFFTQNIGKVNTQGFELKAHYKWLIDDVTINTNAGYQFAESTANQAITLSKYLSSHAKHNLNFNSSISYNNLLVGFNGVYKYRDAEAANAINAAVTKDYFVMDANAKYAFFENQMFVTANVYNVFNRPHADILGAKLPNRWFILGVGFNM